MAGTKVTSVPKRCAAAPGATMHVLFCCGPSFYRHLGVALISLAENNQDSNIEVYLITGIPNTQEEGKLQETVRAYAHMRLKIIQYPLSRLSHFFISDHISHESYLRIFAPAILDPAIDKILYLDADLIVTGNLHRLWATVLDGYALAGVPDPWGEDRKRPLGIPEEQPYVNAGVALMNLAVWREQRLAERLIRFIEAHGSDLLFHDQDAINAVLHQSVRVLAYRWNYQARMLKMDPRQAITDRELIRREARHAAIIHYSGRQKPWQFLSTVARKRLYYNHLKKTAWRRSPRDGRCLCNLPRYCLNAISSSLGGLYRLVWPRVPSREWAGWAVRRDGAGGPGTNP